jgi:hypothetical protein
MGLRHNSRLCQLALAGWGGGGAEVGADAMHAHLQTKCSRTTRCVSSEIRIDVPYSLLSPSSRCVARAPVQVSTQLYPVLVISPVTI